MAKKKKRTKSKSGRRVGAASVNKAKLTDTFLLFTGAVVGAAGRRFIDNTVSKQTQVVIKKEMMQMIRIGEALAGFALAYFMRNPFVQGLGAGMAADAAVNVLQAQGQLTGVGATGPMVLQLPVPKPNFSKNPLPSVGASPGALYNNPTIPSVGQSRKYAGVYGN